jgi:AcrR family transcriptional regulator
MAEVKRTYDTSGRQAQARDRRRAVVQAARELFEQVGYRQTTVAGVAARAGVSAEMVYKAFGSKSALAKAVFDVAVAGDDEPVAVAHRPAMQAVRDEHDAHRAVALFVDGLVQRLERSARVTIMVRDGRHVDAALEPVWAALQQEGLTGMDRLGRHLARSGQVRTDLSPDEVRDLLWNHLAIDHYERLVLGQRWTTARFGEWLSRSIAGAILDPAT